MYCILNLTIRFYLPWASQENSNHNMIQEDYARVCQGILVVLVKVTQHGEGMKSLDGSSSRKLTYWKSAVIFHSSTQ